MNIDPDDFRRYYAELADEALLEIDEGELVPLARDCYRSELQHRGLIHETKKESEEPDRGDLVPVAQFLSAPQADMAKALLESADIPCCLENEFAGKNYEALIPLRLLVPAQLLQDARAILETPISDADLESQAEAEPPPSEA